MIVTTDYYFYLLKRFLPKPDGSLCNKVPYDRTGNQNACGHIQTFMHEVDTAGRLLGIHEQGLIKFIFLPRR
jgi:hypothetical protein